MAVTAIHPGNIWPKSFPVHRGIADAPAPRTRPCVEGLAFRHMPKDYIPILVSAPSEHALPRLPQCSVQTAIRTLPFVITGELVALLSLSALA